MKYSDSCLRLEVLLHVFCSLMNWIPSQNTEEEMLVMAVRMDILHTPVDKKGKSFEKM